FEDANGNGVRDVNEVGIPQVKITATNGKGVLNEAMTDETGYALFNGPEYSCGGVRNFTDNSSQSSTSPLDTDTIMLSIQPPSGNTPAREFMDGPYSARWSSSAKVAYIPFRKRN